MSEGDAIKKVKTIILDYIPKQFPLVPSKSAENFIAGQDEKSSEFIISDLVAEQSGIAQLKRLSIGEEVENQTFEKLKEMQEEARKEAYEAGFIEGRDKAYADKMQEITDRLNKIDEITELMENFKKRMFAENEKQLIKLVYLIASKIVIKEVKEDNEIIIPVIHKALDEIQNDEKIVLQLSTEDYEFIMSSYDKLGRNNQSKNIKIKSSDDLQSGGCIIKSPYGVIDASLEARLEKIWKNLQDHLPHIRKDSEVKALTEDEMKVIQPKVEEKVEEKVERKVEEKEENES